MIQDAQLRNSTIIAIVDDDDAFRSALKTLLRSSGYKVRTYGSALEFLNAKASAEIHCLVSDIQMPGMSGIELNERLIALGFHIPTIFITGYPGAAAHLGANTLVAVLPKPCDPDKLLNCIETALLPRQ
ncbi:MULTISPECIES: response regulator transcription factor [Pseudomonas]|jgi:FixJ family two-component response regulator|uniref:response regulator transcription factor n=1 Tax=Pseudomonas TaxID=286 RepID=UPI000C86D28A|nr:MULTISPECIES: response regulator [Pseudomonas]MSU97370.1 response regulator [Pseudomonas mandelii]PMV88010.1 two-component system response regulator [Pseudomonas sp. GW101-1A09]PMV91783.1 two-component system response regulator [Pseudomonas sp. FW306-2-2C-B10A]PMW00076.1 two-component system response regulator [Pseudomonas sp. GW460-C8]PMW06884.1 two-component system response regulator [Pseudomonas sp. MPR-TSA4]